MLELNFLGCSPNVGTGIQTDVPGQLRQVNGAQQELHSEFVHPAQEHTSLTKRCFIRWSIV